LPRDIQAVNLLDNLVFDGLGHNENNLRKGIPSVKGALQDAFLWTEEEN
jgi:hypothetical protein